MTVREALAGRDYIETLDWSAGEIDEALGLASSEGQFKAGEPHRLLPRSDAVHAVPGQVHADQERVRGGDDAARRMLTSRA